MPNIAVDLPAPAGDGSGAPQVTAAMAPLKTLTVHDPFTGVIAIEFSNDGGATWCEELSFTTPGKRTFELAAEQMRVTRRGVSTGAAPNVDVAAEPGVSMFGTPAVPAGDGAGAALDVSAFGAFNTICVSGPFTGIVVIEISEDGIDWSEIMTFQGPGAKSLEFVATNLRVRRRATSGGAAPVVAVGASEGVGGGTSGVAEPRTCFVYRPGGVASENVYTDWATMFAALAVVEGCKDVLIDDSLAPAVVPAGVWNVDEVVFKAIPLQFALASSGVQLSFADGSSLIAPNTLRWEFHNLFLTNNATAAAPILMAGNSVANFLVLNRCIVETQVAGPLVRIDGAAGLGFGIIDLISTLIQTNGAQPDVIDADSNGGVSIAVLTLYRGARIEADAVAGDAASQITIQVNQLTGFEPQANALGAVTFGVAPNQPLLIGTGGLTNDDNVFGLAGSGGADHWDQMVDAFGNLPSSYGHLVFETDTVTIGRTNLDIRRGLIEGSFRNSEQLHPEGLPGPLPTQFSYGSAPDNDADTRCHVYRRMILRNTDAAAKLGLVNPPTLDFDEYCELRSNPGAGPLISALGAVGNNQIYLGKRCRMHGGVDPECLDVPNGVTVFLILGEGAVVEDDAISGGATAVLNVIPLSSSFSFGTQANFAGTINMMPDAIGPRHSDRMTIAAAGVPNPAIPGTLHPIDTSGGPVNVNLPAITAGNRGQPITLKKTTGDANALTGVPAGGDAINGPTNTATANGSITLYSDGVGTWHTTAVI